MRTSLLLLCICMHYFVSAQFVFHRNQTLAVTKNSTLVKNPWFGGLNAAQFSTMDLNFDGIEDLVVFDRSDDKVLTFINQGTANQTNYQYDPSYEANFPPIKNWMLLRDYNGDGKKDIFCSTTTGIQVYKNTSTSNLSFTTYMTTVLSYQGFTSTYDPSKIFNLYVSQVDIPAISDMDGDGDLDILTFSVLGTYVEYHRNLSMENHGNLDTLEYRLKNTCWGYFSETGSNSNHLKLNDTCSYNVYAPQVRHTGSTLLALDINDNGVTDLLIGDVSFKNVVLAINGGTTPNMNSPVINQDTLFPSYNVPIDLELFPGMFYEDVNNDGVKDLLCSPNYESVTENYESVYYYKNNGTNTLPNFSFVKTNFLQDQTIEAGERSNLAFFDYNGDGLKDMVVSSFGYFVKATKDYVCKLALYENTGNLTQPAFTFVTDDYQSISSIGLGLGLFPAFVDIDNDGDEDLYLGNSEGNIHFLTNTAGAGNVASFTLTQQNITNDTLGVIDVGQFATPQLFDFDKDNDYDLIIGEKNGVLNYYENTGSNTNPIFTFITDTMGGVRIKEPWDTYGTSTGYSVPHFFEQAGTTYLLVGGQQGEGYIYGNIDSNNPTFLFEIEDTLINRNEIGLYLSPYVVDINNDNQVDIFAGSARGGIAYYQAGEQITSITKNFIPQTSFAIYPNPGQQTVTLHGDTETIESIAIYTITGDLVKQLATKNQGFRTLDVSSLPLGAYIIQATYRTKETISKRFIKN